MSLFDTDAIDASENDDIPRDQLTSGAMDENSHLTLIPTEVGEGGGRGGRGGFCPPTSHFLTASKVKVLAS